MSARATERHWLTLSSTYNKRVAGIRSPSMAVPRPWDGSTQRERERKPLNNHRCRLLGCPPPSSARFSLSLSFFSLFLSLSHIYCATTLHRFPLWSPPPSLRVIIPATPLLLYFLSSSRRIVVSRIIPQLLFLSVQFQSVSNSTLPLTVTA